MILPNDTTTRDAKCDRNVHINANRFLVASGSAATERPPRAIPGSILEGFRSRWQISLAKGSDYRKKREDIDAKKLLLALATQFYASASRTVAHGNAGGDSW